MCSIHTIVRLLIKKSFTNKLITFPDYSIKNVKYFLPSKLYNPFTFCCLIVRHVRNMSGFTKVQIIIMNSTFIVHYSNFNGSICYNVPWWRNIYIYIRIQMLLSLQNRMALSKWINFLKEMAKVS